MSRNGSSPDVEPVGRLRGQLVRMRGFDEVNPTYNIHKMWRQKIAKTSTKLGEELCIELGSWQFRRYPVVEESMDGLYFASAGIKFGW